MVAPGFDHVPLTIPVTLSPGMEMGSLQVSSDLAWAMPTVSAQAGGVTVQFQTRDLLASATATITITDGASSVSVFLSADIKPLNVYRLLDDPFRSVMYGIHLDAGNAGAIFTYDPLQGTKGRCVTVGKRPTDFVISEDGSELLVICSADKAISVVDLATLTLKETIPLPVYDAWGSVTDTTANIDLGPGDIIYYTDGSWGPIMRVYERSSGQVIQSLKFDGTAPSNDTGFMDFAVTSDRSKIVAMPQYGWSAGGHSSFIADYSIAPDGRLTFLAKSTVNTGLVREPFEAPVLITENDQTVFLKTIAVSTQDINDIQKNHSSAVWSISPGGEWVATATAVYDFTTGNQLFGIPDATTTLNGYTDRKAQAFSSDYNNFVYFDPTSRTLRSLNLVDLIGAGPGGQSVTPAPGSVVTPPSKLSWAARPGISQYHVYLGTSAAAVSAATPASPEFMGAFSGTQYPFGTPLELGTTYYWRLDPISQIGPQQGSVNSFIVSPISLEQTKLKLRSVAGVGVFEELLPLGAASAGETWSVSSENPWIGFDQSVGTVPGSVKVLLDTSALPSGVHLGSITLTTRVGNLVIPVELDLEPLKLTVLKSDPHSSKVYALSENSGVPGAKAYLMEIDAETESVLRLAEVGTSATDFSIHAHDNKIYVTNWLGGSLLAVDRDTFEVTRTYAFSAFGGTGYGDNDVYRVAAGGPGRLVVEEEDQWIEISIFNTTTGTKLGEASVREGGGAFDSTGRYYYHGENNSSGASILRYDVTGDALTLLADVRPTGVSYYGSRTVLVSENDQRVFWGNVVFNSALAPEWIVGEIVYSCSQDGRFAFAENTIYDINRRLAVLGMPVSTKVSAFNSATSKLVTQGALGLHFHEVSLPLALAAPEFQTPVWSGTSPTLKWTDKSLETAFHLQRRLAGSGTWTDVNTAITQNATTLAVSGLDQMSAYEFRIRALAPEISSAWSEILLADLSQFPPPAPVLNSATASSPYSVGLGWGLSGTNTAVTVERSVGDDPAWSVIATLAAGTRSYTDNSVQPSTSYSYRIKAIKGAVASVASNTRSVATPALTAPSAPSFTSATAVSAYRVVLAWGNVSLETSYRVERKPTAGAVWETLVELPADTVSFSDDSVVPNTAYSYRLFAINAVGSSTASSVRSATTPQVPLPGAPQNVVAQPTSATGVSLAWSDVSNEAGYRIERNIGEEAWEVVGELPAGTTSYVDSGLVNGTYYNYRVVAFNSAGQSISAEVNVLAALTGAILEDDFDPGIDPGVWSSLAGAQAIAGPQGFFSGKALWFGAGGTRSAATMPVDLTNGGNLAFQFRAGNQNVDGGTYWNNSEVGENVLVEYSTSGGSQWELLAILNTQFPSHSGWTSYSIVLPVSARSDATQFRWRQQQNSGVSQDTWALDSVQVQGVLPAPPDAPAFILANANSARAVAVSWAPASGATSYVVERRTPATDWTAVGESPGYESFLTDHSVEPATAYSYRVRAGNSGGYSDPSQYAFVTTWSILQEWRFQNYGTTNASGTSADLEDNDTGIPNLLRYAFNMSKDDKYFSVDLEAGNKGLPSVQVEGDVLQVAFIRRRNPNQAGIRYVVEFCGNLKDWVSGGTEVLAEPIDEDFEFVIWQDAPPTGATGSRFGRVKVERVD